MAASARDGQLWQAATPVNDLATIASTRPGYVGLRAAVEHGGWSQAHAAQLKQVEDLIRLAASQRKKAGIAAAGIDSGEQTWRVLSSLTLRELRLEGADTFDRAMVIARHDDRVVTFIEKERLASVVAEAGGGRPWQCQARGGFTLV